MNREDFLTGVMAIKRGNKLIKEVFVEIDIFEANKVFLKILRKHIEELKSERETVDLKLLEIDKEIRLNKTQERLEKEHGMVF